MVVDGWIRKSFQIDKEIHVFFIYIWYVVQRFFWVYGVVTFVFQNKKKMLQASQVVINVAACVGRQCWFLWLYPRMVSILKIQRSYIYRNSERDENVLKLTNIYELLCTTRLYQFVDDFCWRMEMKILLHANSITRMKIDFEEMCERNLYKSIQGREQTRTMKLYLNIIKYCYQEPRSWVVVVPSEVYIHEKWQI